MRLTCTQPIQSLLLQRASNAPVEITTEWRAGSFSHTSTLTLNEQIAEKNNLPLTPDFPHGVLECALELMHDLDSSAIEERKEIVLLNQLGCSEMVTSFSRAKHYYGSFISPSRKDTTYLGRMGGTIRACPWYNLVVPLSPEEYESLAEIFLANGAAQNNTWFAFSFVHKKVETEI